MKIYLTIMLMAIVTYIPRFLPMSFLKVDKLPPLVKRFLYFIPYAALGALIVPGSFTSVGNNFSLSVFAILLVVVISFLVENIVMVVFSSIIIAYFLLKI